MAKTRAQIQKEYRERKNNKNGKEIRGVRAKEINHDYVKEKMRQLIHDLEKEEAKNES